MRKKILLLVCLSCLVSCNEKNNSTNSKSEISISESSSSPFFLPTLTEENVYDLIKSYANKDGFSITVDYYSFLLNENINITAKILNNIFYTKTHMLGADGETYFDCSTDETIIYSKNGDECYKYASPMSFDEAFNNYFSLIVPPLIAFQDLNNQFDSIEETIYINQPCFLCTKKTMYAEGSYTLAEWYINKKDNLTLKAEKKTVVVLKETTTELYNVQNIEYNADIILPTNFEIKE